MKVVFAEIASPKTPLTRLASGDVFVWDGDTDPFVLTDEMRTAPEAQRRVMKLRTGSLHWMREATLVTPTNALATIDVRRHS